MLGSMVAVTVNGCQAAHSVVAGLQRWVDRLDASDKKWIMHQRYGNEAAAVQKLKARPEHQAFANLHFPVDPQQLKADEFDSKAFLVRQPVHA